jgi:hypothetical protein
MLRGWIFFLGAVIACVCLHALDEMNAKVISPWMDFLQRKLFFFYPGLHYMHVDGVWAISSVLTFVLFVVAHLVSMAIWPWPTSSQRIGKKLGKETKRRLKQQQLEDVAR